jgi:DNA modification methylase
MEINRVWAMPNKLTFTIKPIRELLDRHVGGVVIDPFANDSKLGTITNDLNPEYETDYNMDALSFLKSMKSHSADVVLFDPPYSITQASECYKNYGKEKLETNVSNMAYWANCKNEVARIITEGGVVISFGWTTNGLGKNRGFKIIEILIVPHGGSRNDTLVTVEEKRFTN